MEESTGKGMQKGAKISRKRISRTGAGRVERLAALPCYNMRAAWTDCDARRDAAMATPAYVGSAVFILDCDNTLLDNDGLKDDLDMRLHALLGEEWMRAVLAHL